MRPWLRTKRHPAAGNNVVTNNPDRGSHASKYRRSPWTRHLAAGLTLLAIAQASPAMSAGPKPDFSFRSKVIEIDFVLDPKIKSERGLASVCVAEAKRTAAEARADAEKMYREWPVAFSGAPWANEQTYRLGPVIGNRYVNVLRSDYDLSGGTHGAAARYRAARRCAAGRRPGSCRSPRRRGDT